MEQQQPNSDLFTSTDIKIDDDSRRHLTSLASWTMIIVITSVIGYIFNIIGLFTGPKIPTTTSEGFAGTLQSGSGSAAFVIIALLIGLVINYFLYQFASQSKKSLASFNSPLLASAFRSMKIYFLITTIIVIIIFCFALIAVLAAV